MVILGFNRGCGHSRRLLEIFEESPTNIDGMPGVDEFGRSTWCNRTDREAPLREKGHNWRFLKCNHHKETPVCRFFIQKISEGIYSLVFCIKVVSLKGI